MDRPTAPVTEGAPPTVDHARVAALMASVKELPTLPAIAARVGMVARDPDSTVRDMATVIGQDQALTANLLRVVNSAYFGFIRRISSVFEAINLLGYNEVVKMAFTVAVIHEFHYESANGFDRTAFWSHAICVANASQALAEQLHCAPRDDAFTAGLLHDMGKLILDQFFPDAFGEILQLIHDEGLTSCEAEMGRLGTTHAEIGEWIARSWLLPEATIATIRHHHEPAEQRCGLPNSNDPIVDVVQFADLLCRAEGLGHSGDPARPELPDPPLAHLGLDPNSLDPLRQRLAAVAAETRVFL
ncbi:MAG: hypothetical protein CO080_03215 [Nitrospirae bacterium CG_4_9_14_0_8_um_filter_70_14]|nr:MAG: hypothetical protein CO080_03215 [Nitrospirae bacterium CG_4_9_14_0_8_um_filter_70_14]